MRWAYWQLVLKNMYLNRLSLFQNILSPHGIKVSERKVPPPSFRAMRFRRLITRTRNNGKGTITWGLTTKGRELAKELLHG